MIQKNLSYINDLDIDVRNDTQKWVIQTVDSMIDKDSTSILRLPYIDIDSINKATENGLCDSSYASFLWQYTDDFDDFDSFVKKTQWIGSLFEAGDPPCVADNEISISNINISNSVYNFKIGEEISLIQLTKHLIKKGFSVEFHNWNASHLKVSIPVMENGKNVVSNTNKLKAHRFSVHRNASIKQTSPTFYEAAIEARQMFIDAMSDYTPAY